MTKRRSLSTEILDIWNLEEPDQSIQRILDLCAAQGDWDAAALYLATSNGNLVLQQMHFQREPTTEGPAFEDMPPGWEEGELDFEWARIFPDRSPVPQGWKATTDPPILQTGTATRFPLWASDRLAGMLVLERSFASSRRIKKTISELETALPALTLALLSCARLDGLSRSLGAAKQARKHESEALAAALNPQRLVPIVLRLASMATGFDGALLGLLDGPDLVATAETDLPQNCPESGTSLSGTILDVETIEGQVVFSSPNIDKLEQYGLSRVLTIPLDVDGKTLGGLVLVASEPPTSPDSEVLDVLDSYARHLEFLLSEQQGRSDQLQRHENSLRNVALAVEMTRPAMRGHADRVGALARTISERLAGADIQVIRRAAALHDLGLLPAADASAVAVEYLHPSLGASLVLALQDGARLARTIAEHHETYDGMGFPEARSGDKLSLEGCILAAAENLVERMTASAVGPALSFQQAAAAASSGSGSIFHPDVAKAAAHVLEEWSGQTRPCYEWKACPQKIRRACPAYRSDSPCWTNPAVSCHLHGDPDCRDCLVWKTFAQDESPAKRAAPDRGPSRSRAPLSSEDPRVDSGPTDQGPDPKSRREPRGDTP